MLLVAAGLAAAAAALAAGRPHPSGPRGVASAPGPRGATTGWAATWSDSPGVGVLRGARPGARELLGLGFLVAAVLAWTAPGAIDGTRVAVAAVGVGAAAAVVRGSVLGRRAEEARRRRQVVVDLCEALVGELRAGQPVQRALECSAIVWPDIGPAVAAGRLDADLPDALRRLARSPGAEALDHLAAAWQLCAATGGGLTAAAGQVLESARAEAAALRQVDAEASSARATARLVAGLPVVVLVAGQGLGARPWSFLLGRPIGAACLAAGVLLVILGLAWIDRIATSATAPER